MSGSSSRTRTAPRGIVVRIGGKNGVGKTTSLSDLINALPPNALPTFELDDDTKEPEVRS
jgi:ABC-type cobalamin/Fe3+-siderophores transport system ATPase subunit